MRHAAARTLELGSVVALVAFFGASAHADGHVYNVNSVADVVDSSPGDNICETATGNGICTLRAAMMEANLKFDSESVTINVPAGTYLLTRPVGIQNGSNGELEVFFNLNEIHIVGAGADRTIIDANHVDRAFHFYHGTNVTLYDLRVQGGRPPDDHDRVGGGNGAGILNEDGGSLSLVRCLIRDNAVASTVATTSWAGGGIYSDGGSLTLTDSAVRINAAVPGYGGGIYANATAITISGSSVYSNSAKFGGGVEAVGGSLAVVNSTIGGNVASDSGGGLVVLNVDNATLNNVTLAANTASGTYPAGSDGEFISASATLSNSILQGEDLACSGATLTSNGHNFIGSLGGCTVTGAFYDAFYDLNLGTFGFYGGTTATYPLLSGSIALNAGSPPTAGNPFGCTDATGAPLATDQRGVKRKIGAACDLGAFEVEPIGDVNGDGIVDVADVFYLVNFLFAGGAVPRGRADVDGVFGIDISDVFYLVNFLFAGGPAPH